MKSVTHFLFALCLCMPGISWAESLPEMPVELQGKTITMLIPWNPGGDTDATQRFVVEQVKRISGLKIVVVNRGGAQGIIGARELAESNPNGLTIMGHANETFVINPVLENTAVDLARLSPVAIYAFTPQFIYTGSQSGIQNINDIVRKARSDPKFAIGCNSKHQCMYISQFLDHYGIKPHQVMFRTPAEMAISAANGDITIFGAGGTSGAPFVQSGRIRAVAATWPNKLSAYPDAEALGSIIPGYRANNIQMLSVPAGTPAHIIQYYNSVFRAAIKLPETVKRFSELSVVPVDLSVKQVEHELANELLIMKKNKKFAE
jgi:tripartite-type tricarboxylate transporter receptor subunit TctC